MESFAYPPRAAARLPVPDRRLPAAPAARAASSCSSAGCSPRWCASRSSRALRAINFNVLTERAGLDNFLRQGGMAADTTSLFGVLVYWLVILAALLIAFNGLGLSYITDLLGRVVLVRAERVRRAADPGLRRLLRALRRRRGDGLRPQRQHAGRDAPRQARAVRDHGLRGADRARPDQGRRRHRAPELPHHPRRAWCSRWRWPSASAARTGPPSASSTGGRATAQRRRRPREPVRATTPTTPAGRWPHCALTTTRRP